MNTQSYKIISLLITLLLALSFAVSPAEARKRKQRSTTAPEKAVVTSPIEARIASMSTDDRRRFDALSKKQQSKIRKGQIEKGFNAWMVELAMGKPFYATEHHPIYTDYEEVWLYTKPDVTESVRENKIIDPQTNWPTIHRKSRKKICYIADFFVLWDRGVVERFHRARERKAHGSCTIETQEAFLPIVNGKPVEPPR